MQTLSESPKLILLNGGSSAGKTSLAKAVQEVMAEPYMLLGIDAFWLAMPPKQLDLDQVDPEYFSWKYEKVGDAKYFHITPGPLLNAAMIARYRATLEYLKEGFNVVADEVIWNFDWVLQAKQIFADFDVYLVGVYCDEAELDRRESARGDRYSGWGRGSQYFAHRNMQYDLTVNTTRSTPVQLATQIKETIEAGLKPKALSQLPEEFATV